MDLRLGKRGFLLTMLALLIVIFFSVMYSSRTDIPLDSKVELAQSRVTVMNGYVDAFYRFAESAGSISGYYALNGVLSELSSTRSYQPNFEAEMMSCVDNGTLGPGRNCIGMTNKTINYFLDSFRVLSGDQLKLSSSYVINSINVTQRSDPFTIDIIMNITLNASDAFSTMQVTKVVNSKVNLEGFNDPLFMLNGTYNQTIRRYNVMKRDGTWNVTDLNLIYHYGQYNNFIYGVSYMDRMKGNFVNSTMGIESFMNLSRVTLGVNQSAVDYYYLTGTTFDCHDMQVVYVNQSILSLIPAPFQLDQINLRNFNINSTNTSRIC